VASRQLKNEYGSFICPFIHSSASRRAGFRRQVTLMRAVAGYDLDGTAEENRAADAYYHAVRGSGRLVRALT
jgi:hypothetical protein